MNWRLWTWKDMVGFLLVMGLIAGMCLVLIDPQSPLKRTNHGFGPEWECRSMIEGDPVCIKKPPPQPKAEK